jgi:hypothetical protein
LHDPRQTVILPPMMNRSLLAILLTAVGLLCASCGDPREAAVEAAFYDHENAMNWRDGATTVALYSSESLAIYDALLKHALDSDAATVKRLSPAAASEIFRMRNRCEAAQIEAMSGAAWAKYATEQGWYSYEEDPDRPEYLFEIGAIRISADGARATGQILVDGEPLARPLEFVREDDRWKRQLKSELDIVTDQLRAWATETRTNVYDLLMMWEEEEWGEVRPDMWRPMRQRR